MAAAMLLFMLENCLIDINVDYSSLWSHLPTRTRQSAANVFEEVREMRRKLSKKRYCSLVEKVSQEVDLIERAAANRSKLNFDPSKVLLEVKKRNVMVYAYSMFGEKAVAEILDLHALSNIFDGSIARLRVDQPPNFIFPLRVARRRLKERQGDILFLCADANTIKSVKEAKVAGVKTVALPVRPSEVRNIVMTKPDVFLPTLSEIVDLLDLGLV